MKTTCRHNRDHTYDNEKVETLRSVTSFFFFFFTSPSFEEVITNVCFLALRLNLTLKTAVQTAQSSSNRCSYNSCLSCSLPLVMFAFLPPRVPIACRELQIDGMTVACTLPPPPPPHTPPTTRRSLLMAKMRVSDPFNMSRTCVCAFVFCQF